MRLERGKLSSLQLMLFITGFIQGTDLLISFVIGVTKHDTWLAVIAAFAVSLPMALVYITFAEKFPRKSLIQINNIIYGRILGSMISTLYIWFFLSLAVVNLRNLSNFLTTYMMPETPMVVIITMFTILFAWTVRNGIEVMARCCFVFVLITSVIAILTTILLAKDMKFTNFLPIFEVPLEKFIQGTHGIASTPFTQIVAFLMITPYVNKIGQIRKAILLGLVLGGVTLLIMVIRDTAVLGITESIVFSQPFEAVRFIHIAKIITRLETLVAIVLMLTLFLRICFFYYVAALGIAQLFNLRTYLPLVLPLGIIIINLSILVYDSSVEQAYFNTHVFALYTMPFEFLIPILSLIIITIHQLNNKREEDCN